MPNTVKVGQVPGSHVLQRQAANLAAYSFENKKHAWKAQVALQPSGVLSLLGPAILVARNLTTTGPTKVTHLQSARSNCISHQLEPQTYVATWVGFSTQTASAAVCC